MAFCWRRESAAAATAAILLSAAGAACQETVSTDRPGLGFHPGTVGAENLQIELGIPNVDYAGTADDPALSLVAAARYGLTDRIEARLATTYLARTPAPAGAEGPTGVAGLRAGLKLGVMTGPNLALALIPVVVLPVGDEALAGDRASYALNAAAGIPLGAAGLTLVAGAQADPSGEDDYETTGLLVAVLGTGLTEAVSGYVEAGALPGPGDDAAYAGLGAAWLVTNLVQLDAWADFGLTDAASGAVFGVGASFLIP